MFHSTKRLVIALALLTILALNAVASSEERRPISPLATVVAPTSEKGESPLCSDGSPGTTDECESHMMGELTALGPHGNIIALAREQALQILRAPNQCSAWYEEVEPNVEGVFSSLHFELDENGNTEVFSARSDSGELLYKDPWGAKTNQYAGSNAVVQINGNGPFFVRLSRVRELRPTGVARGHSGWHLLSIASYMGDSPEARLAIMLHELGHIVGRLPTDDDSWDGQSSRNTREVLHHCKAEIQAVAHKPSRTRN